MTVPPHILAESDQEHTHFDAALNDMLAALRRDGARSVSSGERFMRIAAEIAQFDSWFAAEIASAAIMRLLDIPALSARNPKEQDR